MKVKSLVNATKEFERLQSLIEKIEEYLGEFAKVNTDNEEDNVLYINGGTISFNFTCDNFTIPKKRKEKVNVTLCGDVSDFVRDDVVELLKAKLVELKRQQDALEL